MLKAVYDTLEEVPEAFRENYEKQDGKYVLQVDGMVPKAKVDEFRQTNIDLRQELDEVKDKYKGVDVEEIDTLRDRVNELEQKRSTKEKDFEKELDAKVKAATEPLAKEKDAALKRAESLESDLAKVKIDNALREAGTQLGIRATAMEDLISRGQKLFRMEEGKVIPYDENGDKVYSQTTGELLSPSQFVERLTEQAPHLFEPNKGTGTSGDGKGGSGGQSRGINPWKKDTWNLTAQGSLIKQDKELAKRMAAEAGHKLSV
jgi:hypothetical protein